MKHSINRLFVIIIAVLLAMQPVLAQGVSKVSTTAASFLEIGIGSRAVSMGGAYVGLADDVTSLYWNPGGLALMPKNEVTFIHTQWLAGIDFNYIAGAFPMGSLGTIGAAITTLNSGDMLVRTVERPEGTGERFDATDMSIALGWGRSFTDRFTFGANVKYIEQRIWHMKANTMAIDLGTTFRTQFRDMRIGMSVSNFGSKMKMEGRDTQIKYDIDDDKEGNNSKINAHLDTDEWSLPLLFRVGVAADVVKTPFAKLTMTVDAAHPNNYAESVAIGAEATIMNIVYLRGGTTNYLNDTDEDGNQYSPQGMSLGAGLNYLITRNMRVKLDYAYGDFGLLSDVQRFSIALEF